MFQPQIAYFDYAINVFGWTDNRVVMATSVEVRLVVAVRIRREQVTLPLDLIICSGISDSLHDRFIEKLPDGASPSWHIIRGSGL